MKLDKERSEEILIKKNNLDNLKIYLKAEFVGIDNIIDDVINSFTPFYIFPESLVRPLVINLWGLTGTGKTSLIEKIVDFLNLRNQYLKFDIGEYNSTNNLKSDLGNKINQINTNSAMIVFDEFQLGRTISEAGNEVDKTSLRPVWDLLDSGIIYAYNTKNYTYLIDFINKIKRCIELGVEVVNGYVVKNEKIYDQIFSSEFDYKIYDYKEISEEVNEHEYYNVNNNRFITPRFIKKQMFEYYFFEINPDFFDNVNDVNFHFKYFNTDLKNILKFVEKDFLNNLSLIEKKDFSKSVIFCLGNLDEVYHMSHNINPDEDADIFYENSLKITLPEVKKALSTRFRMEQIARLGNIHYIYPSMNKNVYNNLIELLLKKKKEYIKNTWDIQIIFDKTINEILYKEGVYPSQGTRPLMSTFNMMIDSYLSNILTYISSSDCDINIIEWKFKDKKYDIILSSDINKYILEYNVSTILEDLRKSDNSDLQALIAVHEAGHALVGALTMNIAPTEILSKTANLSEGFCRYDLNDIVETKKFLVDRIKLCLGGILAEELIFGKDNITKGSHSDLKHATDIAFNLVKNYGMTDLKFLLSVKDESIGNTNYVVSDKFEDDIIQILNVAREETKKILFDNKSTLLILAKYLTKNSILLKEDFKNMLTDLNIQWKENTCNFKEILEKC